MDSTVMEGAMESEEGARALLSEVLREQTMRMLRSPSLLVGWLVEWGEVGAQRRRGVVISEGVDSAVTAAPGSSKNMLTVYDMKSRHPIGIDTTACKIMKVYPYLREYVIIASHWAPVNSPQQPDQGHGDQSMLEVIKGALEGRGVSNRLDELAAKLPPSHDGVDSPSKNAINLLPSKHHEQAGLGAPRSSLLSRGGLQSREDSLRRLRQDPTGSPGYKDGQSAQKIDTSIIISDDVDDESSSSATSAKGSLAIEAIVPHPQPPMSPSCDMQQQEVQEGNIAYEHSDPNEFRNLYDVHSDDDASQSTYNSAECSVGSRLRRRALREKAKMVSQLLAFQEPPIRRSTADEVMMMNEESSMEHSRSSGNKNNKGSPPSEVTGARHQDRFTISIPAAIVDHSPSPKLYLHHERKQNNRRARPDIGSVLNISTITSPLDTKHTVEIDDGAIKSPLTLQSISSRPILLQSSGKMNSMWKIASEGNDPILNVQSMKVPERLSPLGDSVVHKRRDFMSEEPKLIAKSMKPIARLAPIISNSPSKNKFVRTKSVR